MPGLQDPFAGGGTIPLEAQRLGLKAYASDLNPVAVLINKAMIEIPPTYCDCPPVNPQSRKKSSLVDWEWKGTEGLAEDVRYYGQWVRDEALKQIGHMYPQVEITPKIVQGRPDLEEYQGQKLTVIAWLWARTVKSPNPAFSNINVPLASTFVLSTKGGRGAFVSPVIQDGGYQFVVMSGKPPKEAKEGTKAGRGGNFRCIMSGAPIGPQYIRSEGVAGRMEARLMAVVAEGNHGRVYLDPLDFVEEPLLLANTDWFPEGHLPAKHRAFTPTIYGMTEWKDLFTRRQLSAMSTFAHLISCVSSKILYDHSEHLCSSHLKGSHLQESYARAVTTYISLALSKVADYNCSLVPWYTKEDRPGHLFSQQAVPMVWDFTELNPLTDIGGTLQKSVKIVADAIAGCCPHGICGVVSQADAVQLSGGGPFVFSTDPPYYDNVPYADLSDFFYTWLRPVLRKDFPELFSTISTPKLEELVATPERHGGKDMAEQLFLSRMEVALRRIRADAHPAFPTTVYYAFKQSETDSSKGTISTGWETFLEAAVRAGFAIHGTWPMRTERSTRSRGLGSNALASSIVLVCRPRTDDSLTVSRRQFIRELNSTLPLALDAMTRETEGLHSPVAPVDLSQAIIGPGMAVFSKYAAVLEADGSPMTVRTALQLINRFLAEDDFDADTQFCLHWFEQCGWESGKFGDADTLARAKGTSVDGVKNSGVLYSSGGNVRLLKWAEYPTDWRPQTDQRLPVWEVLHQLVRVFSTTGETGAGLVFVAVQSKVEAARQLAYRLYTLCERTGRAEDARAYNELITSWTGIESAAAKEPALKQGELF
ncbi:MAG: DUF1156 domain-containing protein [Planctomycetaceae bacterium]|nr:DUF1156 domain-containing protein [Planctomycetaceae bacterium]